MADDASRPKKAAITPGAWQEARALIYAHRKRLSLGLVLLLVNRVAGFVLPASPKWLIDRVIGQHRPELLLPLALATGAATLVQAVTGFGLSQILGVAAQRAITDMRRTVQAYVLRLPGRCSASAARSMPRSPGDWARPWAASASSKRTTPSGASGWCSRAAPTRCSATSLPP